MHLRRGVASSWVVHLGISRGHNPNTLGPHIFFFFPFFFLLRVEGWEVQVRKRPGSLLLEILKVIEEAPDLHNLKGPRRFVLYDRSVDGQTLFFLCLDLSKGDGLDQLLLHWLLQCCRERPLNLEAMVFLRPKLRPNTGSLLLSRLQVSGQLTNLDLVLSNPGSHFYVGPLNPLKLLP